MKRFLLVLLIAASVILPWFVINSYFSTTPKSMADQVVELVNRERLNAGLSPFVRNRSLDEAADLKATDMFERGYWSHNTPDGERPWVFINETDYILLDAGENLARGYTTAEAVVEGWMNSPSHRELILSDFVDVGVSVQHGELEGEQTTLIVLFVGVPADGERPALRVEWTNNFNGIPR